MGTLAGDLGIGASVLVLSRLEEASVLVLALGSDLFFQLVGVYVVGDCELLAVFQLGVEGLLGDDGDAFSGEDLFEAAGDAFSGDDLLEAEGDAFSGEALFEMDSDNLEVSLFRLEFTPKLSFLTAGVISLPVSSSVFFTLLTTGRLTTGTMVSGMFHLCKFLSAVLCPGARMFADCGMGGHVLLLSPNGER